MQYFKSLLFLLFIILTSMTEATSISRQHRDNDEYEDVSEEVDVERRMHQLNRHRVSVRYFAKHVLCRRHEWRRYFYKALLEQYYCMKERFVANLVVSLCTNKGELLYKFVSELFDADEDGYINEYEKYQFSY